MKGAGMRVSDCFGKIRLLGHAFLPVCINPRQTPPPPNAAFSDARTEPANVNWPKKLASLRSTECPRACIPG
jgi:hypothetical protein